MNNPYSHMRRRQQKQRRTSSILPAADCSQPNKMGSGLNNKFLNCRRENILNTGYNKRRNQLETITIENKKIYQRLNSQKTVYSRQQMNKSYESSCSISRRLSESKISQRNSSRASLRSSKVNRNKPNSHIKPQRKYQIKTSSIQTMKQNDITTFKKLFAPSQNRIPTTSKERRSSVGAGLFDRNTMLPPIKDSVRKPSRKSQVRIPLSNKNQGGFLHKIAQEMFGSKKNKNPNLTVC